MVNYNSNESFIGKILATLFWTKACLQRALQIVVTKIQNKWNNLTGKGVQLNDDEDFSEGIQSLNIKELRYRNHPTIDLESQQSSNQTNAEFTMIHEQFNALIFQTEPQSHTAMTEPASEVHVDALNEFTEIKFSNDDNQQDQTSTIDASNKHEVQPIQSLTDQQSPTTRLSFFQQQKLLETEAKSKKAEEYSKMNETQKVEYDKAIKQSQDHELLKTEHYGRLGNIYVSRSGLLDVRSSPRSSQSSMKSNITSNVTINNNTNNSISSESSIVI